ncbi:uncharacterized protein LOC135814742 [Sycon ciliatum]|uniref:uncharacterized protein LOC135814742 n=1 Tax=Sycon ciliatum TaxID=27933 RepID=UPI0031F6D9D9
MDNGCFCPATPPTAPASSADSCQNDIGLAVGIGVLVACVIILVAWLIFYICCYRRSGRFSRLHSSAWGGSTAIERSGGGPSNHGTSSHKHFAGNYFVDANDSYLLESGQPQVEFNYFNEGATDSGSDALPQEGSQVQTPDATATHRTLAPQSSQKSAALLEDTSASSSFSPNLGDRANFPIIGHNDNLPPMADNTMSLRSNTTMAAMDLSFWPSLPGESNVDLRAPVLSARMTADGEANIFTSEQMQVILSFTDTSGSQAGAVTIGTSSRPEDQPDLDQASSLVTSVYTVSSLSAVSGTSSASLCQVRVPLSCHLMDIDSNDETGYDSLPEVNNLVVMTSKLNEDGTNSEWTDVGPVADFVECSQEARSAGGDCPSGYVEFGVTDSALYTVRCDSGIWVKSMCLSHFAAALDEDQTWALRVFLHRDRTVDYETITQYAKEFNMMPVGMPQPFHLPQHSYVHVLISSITEGCALDGSSHGVLHGEGCWPNLEQPPFVEFRLRQVHGCLPLPLVRVRTDVVVADDFDNITFELLSQWSTKAQMKMDKKMPDSLLCNSSAAGPWPWLLVSPWQQLTKAQVNQMAAILDRPLMGDQDYSTLAALLGYTEEQVKFFSLQRPSPTEALLKDLHTRLPVNRITDRLLVAMGRMGAVWLSDFLRQACRVDRATALALNEDITSSVGDTLPRRAASGIYSSIRRTLNGTLKLTDEEKRDSLGHYQRRVQRMSGRKLVTNKRSSAAASSASVAIYASASAMPTPPTSAPPVTGKSTCSPNHSWTKPLINNQDSVEDLTRSINALSKDDLEEDEVCELSGKHNDLTFTASGQSEKRNKIRGQSTSALYASTKVVVEKHGRLAQVLTPAGPSGAVYTLHHDPAAPHRAILQPAPYIGSNHVASSFHQSLDQPTMDGESTHPRESSIVSRVAKKLTRTSSMPSTERSAKRKIRQRPVSNDVSDDILPSLVSDSVLKPSPTLTTPQQVNEQAISVPKRLHPYEEHIVPAPPRKESLRPRPQ